MKENDMKKSKSKKLPKFSSLDDVVEFVDTHDMGDYWDQLPEAHFDVDLKRNVQLVPIDSKLAGQIQQVARSKHTSTEALINSWLREKVSRSKNATK